MGIPIIDIDNFQVLGFKVLSAQTKASRTAVIVAELLLIPNETNGVDNVNDVSTPQIVIVSCERCSTTGSFF